MPGIVGMINSGARGETAAELERMLLSLLHESFYSSGSFESKDDGLSLGWVGIDEQASGAMFAQSNNTRVVLAGELYAESHQSTVDQPAFAKQVLQAYEKDGDDCLVSLNGWFCGVLQDIRRKRFLVFNDRYGHGRLYWHRNTDGLFFATEAKALLAIRPELRTLDPKGLSEWLSCGSVLQNRTLYTNIRLLPPASAWAIQANGSIRECVYFRSEEWEKQETLSAKIYLEKLASVLPNILKRYRADDRRAAISLTGGLDGRLIMAWSKIPSGELPCYTFSGPYRECADARIAKRIAAACGQSHQIISIGSGFFADFPELATKSAYLSDGTMDVTGAAELYLNREARKIAPVRLTGNYGSEILREYVAFRPSTQSIPGIDSSLAEPMARAAKTYASEAQVNRLSFIAFKQVPWHHYARSAVERSQLIVRSPYLDNDLVSLAYQAPEEAKCVTALLHLSAVVDPQLGTIPNDRGISAGRSAAINQLKMLYHELLAKVEYAYDYGMPQWLARLDNALSFLHLEKLYLGHQKFCHFRLWYQQQLSDFVRDILLDDRTKARSWFDHQLMEKVIIAHLSGNANYTMAIHKLLSLELLCRSLIDPI